ncbi:MAG: hypothetical protein ABI877_13965, partial [Gemmatimonadaceae bacterium]
PKAEPSMQKYFNEVCGARRCSLGSVRFIAVAALFTALLLGCRDKQDVAGGGGTADASTAQDPDVRTAIVLPAQGRNMVLVEMRVMLTSVQEFVAAAARGDTATMRTAAQASGMAAARDMNPAMEQRLPAEFVRLGMSTHAAWDSLATDVSRGGPTSMALGRLGTIMSNCVACHAQFRINPQR